MARGAPEMGDYWEPLRASVEEANDTIRTWIDAGKIAPIDPLLFQINIWAVTQHYAEYEAQARKLMGTPEGQPMAPNASSPRPARCSCAVAVWTNKGAAYEGADTRDPARPLWCICTRCAGGAVDCHLGSVGVVGGWQHSRQRDRAG